VGLIYGNMDHTTESRLTEDRYTSVLDGSGIELVECQSSLLYDSMDLSLGGGGGSWSVLGDASARGRINLEHHITIFLGMRRLQC
jgi:hypothetical protein